MTKEERESRARQHLLRKLRPRGRYRLAGVREAVIIVQAVDMDTGKETLMMFRMTSGTVKGDSTEMDGHLSLSLQDMQYGAVETFRAVEGPTIILHAGGTTYRSKGELVDAPR